MAVYNTITYLPPNTVTALFAASDCAATVHLVSLGNSVYIGGAGVTSSNGYPLPESTEKIYKVPANDVIYGLNIGATGTDVQVLIFNLVD